VTSDGHALATLLDPAIPLARLAAVRGLLYCAGNGSLEAAARSALNRTVDSLGMSREHKTIAHPQLNGIIMGTLPLFVRGCPQTVVCSPHLWWGIEGLAVSETISKVAVAVFSLYGSSAGKERVKAGRYPMTRNVTVFLMMMLTSRRLSFTTASSCREILLLFLLQNTPGPLSRPLSTAGKAMLRSH
jgi:hypothetical protein